MNVSTESAVVYQSQLISRLPLAIGLIVPAVLFVHPDLPRWIWNSGLLPRSLGFRGLGYLAHAGAYTAITGVVLYWARPRTVCSLGSWLTLLAVHGLLTETAQHLIPTRDCDLFDLLANFAGILFAACLYSLWGLKLHPMVTAHGRFSEEDRLNSPIAG